MVIIVWELPPRLLEESLVFSLPAKVMQQFWARWVFLAYFVHYFAVVHHKILYVLEENFTFQIIIFHLSNSSRLNLMRYCVGLTALSKQWLHIRVETRSALFFFYFRVYHIIFCVARLFECHQKHAPRFVIVGFVFVVGFFLNLNLAVSNRRVLICLLGYLNFFVTVGRHQRGTIEVHLRESTWIPLWEGRRN